MQAIREILQRQYGRIERGLTLLDIIEKLYERLPILGQYGLDGRLDMFGTDGAEFRQAAGFEKRIRQVLRQRTKESAILSQALGLP